MGNDFKDKALKCKVKVIQEKTFKDLKDLHSQLETLEESKNDLAVMIVSSKIILKEDYLLIKCSCDSMKFGSQVYIPKDGN
jgi:hypothetical protein